MRFNYREILFVPNLLTYLRLALLPIIYYWLTIDKLIWAAALGVLAMATDILDGVLARKLNQVSVLGQVLDPLTDKISIAVFAIFVVLHRDFPLWAAALVIGRDVLILIAALFFSSKFKQIPVSNFLGKIAALSWGILFTIYALDWNPLKTPFLTVSLLLLAASVLNYGRGFIAKLKSV